MKHFERTNNHNEFNTICALNSNELKSFCNESEEEVMTIKETIIKEEEKKAAEKAAEKAAFEMLSEEEKWEIILERDLSNSRKTIEQIVGKKDFSMQDMAIVKAIADDYSDAYKDLNGIRPHFYLEQVFNAIERKHSKVWAEYVAMDFDTWCEYSRPIIEAYWQAYREAHQFKTA